jgi:hypothetical protein
MPGAPGARYTFFTEAVELAPRGIASLLPDPPYSRPPIEDVVSFEPTDRDGIMSAVPRLSTDMRRLGGKQGADDLAAYEGAMRPIDALNYLPHAAPNALFFQFGKEDTRPSPDEGRQAAAAASAPKQARWYDGGHELNDHARADRQNWLAQRLGAA